MQYPVKTYLTPEEYLALEEKAEYKSEYYKGEIFAMSGASINHNRIVINLAAQLNLRLRGSKCEAFMNDMRLWVEEKELYTYPDIVVICGDTQFYPDRDDTITNPLLIVEVLSNSTKNYDRGDKFQFYRTLPSFKEYVLVDQYDYHVENFYIGSEGQWMLKEYNDKENSLKLFNVEFQMHLQDIYHGVTFVN